jgi:hypothetical protein
LPSEKAKSYIYTVADDEPLGKDEIGLFLTSFPERSSKVFSEQEKNGEGHGFNKTPGRLRVTS